MCFIDGLHFVPLAARFEQSLYRHAAGVAVARRLGGFLVAVYGGAVGVQGVVGIGAAAVIGDSICSFNPIYGQGMTVAALQADALSHHLERNRRLHVRRFQTELAGVVGRIWQVTTAADLQHPGIEGRRTLAQKLLGRYVRRLHAAAAHDPRLSLAFLRVAGLVDPPPALMRPATARRVLWPSKR